MVSSSDMNPLCVTAECRAIFENGRKMELGLVPPFNSHVYGRFKDPSRKEYQAQIGIYHLLENLKQVFGVDKEGVIAIFPELEARIRSLEDAQKRTYQQFLSGESSEFKDLIVSIIDERLRGLMPGPSEEGGEVLRKLKMSPEEKIEREMSKIDDQIAKLSPLILPGVQSAPMLSLKEILDQSLEVQAVMRNPAIVARERARRIYLWTEHLKAKQELQRKSAEIGAIQSRQFLEKLRKAGNKLVYQLSKVD